MPPRKPVAKTKASTKSSTKGRVKKTTARKVLKSKTSSTPTSTEVKNILKSTVAAWSSECVSIRYGPRNWATHTEVRFNADRQRRRFDLVTVVRWNMKKPKDIFGVEIKTTLKDFEGDRKWTEYLPYCHYFCFACPASNTALLEAIQTSTPKHVGVLAVHTERAIIQVIRAPVRQPGQQSEKLYETLYERSMSWSGSDEFVLNAFQ